MKKVSTSFDLCRAFLEAEEIKADNFLFVLLIDTTLTRTFEALP